MTLSLVTSGEYRERRKNEDCKKNISTLEKDNEEVITDTLIEET